MKTIYYTNPENKNRVAKTVTDFSIERLHQIGIFESDTRYLVLPENYDGPDFPNPTIEAKYFDCLTFDDLDAPTQVTVDLEHAKTIWLEDVRWRRNQLLGDTDMALIKAIGMGNKTLQEEIENDKVALRNVTDTLDLSNVKSIDELLKLSPTILDIDFAHKYANYKPKKPKNKKQPK